MRIIIDELTALGYNIKFKVLNSMEYGNIPQNRERIYIVGYKKLFHYNSFEFPKPIKLSRNLSDCLDAIVDDRYYYNNKPIYNILEDKVINLDTVYQWRRAYVRENKKGVCPTLTANMGMGGHNVPIIRDFRGIRKLTPKECSNFQGFPDTYLFPSIADIHLYKQIGNSVSIPVVARIAQSMLKAMGR
jgi:DNA (cytosine-5)-methyltransferase 1